MKKSLSNGIDNFCARHPRFGLNNLMMYIITGNVAVYLFALLDSSGSFLLNLSFNLDFILKGQIWRLFTYIFLPVSTSLFGFIVTLYFYYVIGNILEQVWGTPKFNLYYLFGIILSTFCGVVISLIWDIGYLGLSSFYINMSLFFAYATLYPDNIVLLFFILPIKIKYLALLDAVIFIVNIVGLPFPLNLIPVVAILNYLIFCFDDLRYYFKRNVNTNKARYSKQSVNFREETRQAEKENSTKPYRHKCAVCGRTDTDYPDLQFRYCSRCAGYHCFCEDHINNHIHFTE